MSTATQLSISLHHRTSVLSALSTTGKNHPWPSGTLTDGPGPSVGPKDAPSRTSSRHSASPEQDSVNSLGLHHLHHARDRPSASKHLPPVSPFAASELSERDTYTPSGSSITYQRDDGQRGKHWRSDTERRNPGVKGNGWQCRRFDPADPLAAAAICLAEGEKDAAILATAGLIAFTAPSEVPRACPWPTSQS